MVVWWVWWCGCVELWGCDCVGGGGLGGGGVVCVGACCGFGVWVVWGGFPLRSNIPRSALCATLDTYNFCFAIPNLKTSSELWRVCMYYRIILCSKTRLKILLVLTREHYTSLLHWV
jgi:hypothetical protein